MQQAKQDLILSDIPEPRKISLDLASIDSSRLTLLDALDIVEVTGIPAEKFDRTLAGIKTGISSGDSARLLYAFAWVILRKVERDVTWAEMQTYDLKIVGAPLDEQAVQNIDRRATAVMNVVRLAGVSPSEAEQLSLAQVKAVLPPPKRRRRG